MSVESSIRDAIIAIQRDVVGVEAAPFIPYGVQRYNLPMFVNFPSGATYTRTTSDMLQVVRNWNMDLLVEVAGDSLPSVNELDVYTYIEAVQTAFGRRERLATSTTPVGVTTVMDAALVSDTGIIRIPYAIAEFYGIRFVLRMEYNRYLKQTTG